MNTIGIIITLHSNGVPQALAAWAEALVAQLTEFVAGAACMIRRLIDAALATPRAFMELAADCAFGPAEHIPLRQFEPPAFTEGDWSVLEDPEALGYHRSHPGPFEPSAEPDPTDAGLALRAVDAPLAREGDVDLVTDPNIMAIELPEAPGYPHPGAKPRPDFRKSPLHTGGLPQPCQCRERCGDFAEDDDYSNAICRRLPG